MCVHMCECVCVCVRRKRKGRQLSRYMSAGEMTRSKTETAGLK